jgi:hypothetical protein
VVLESGDIYDGHFVYGLPKGNGNLISGLHKLVFLADFNGTFEPNYELLELEFPDRSMFKGKLKKE